MHSGAQVRAVQGYEALEGVAISDADGERHLATCATFVMVGAAPNTGWLSELVALDDKGFVVTGQELGASYQYATSRSGIHAVGDVRAGSFKRVASSVGEGSVVISTVWEHVGGPAQHGGVWRSRWARAASVHQARSSAKRRKARASHAPPPLVGRASAFSASPIRPTATELEMMTMLISDSVPCQASPARPCEAACRVAGDRCAAPISFFQEVIDEVSEPRLDAPPLLARHGDEGAGLPDLAGGICLVHAIQHRKANRPGVDQLGVDTAFAVLPGEIFGQPDA